MENTLLRNKYLPVKYRVPLTALGLSTLLGCMNMITFNVHITVPDLKQKVHTRTATVTSTAANEEFLRSFRTWSPEQEEEEEGSGSSLRAWQDEIRQTLNSVFNKT